MRVHRRSTKQVVHVPGLREGWGFKLRVLDLKGFADFGDRNPKP